MSAAMFHVDHPTIAALYIQRGGVYWNLPGVDAWDETRDARNYNGPWPVVAHPPCNVWCQLAHMNQKRWGHKVGDDDGCFDHALRCVQQFGGVLEHPAYSYAWAAFGLPAPTAGCWKRDITGAWVSEVSQVAYGHRARKRTWLYAVCACPPSLDWSEPAPTAQVGWCANHGDSALPRISKKAAEVTPLAFREMLMSIARSVPQQSVAA